MSKIPEGLGPLPGKRQDVPPKEEAAFTPVLEQLLKFFPSPEEKAEAVARAKEAEMDTLKELPQAARLSEVILQKGTQVLLGQPLLQEPDLKTVERFVLRAKNVGGSGKLPVVNSWMNAGAAVELFFVTMNVINLLSKMSREQSKLQQKMAMVIIATAKEISEFVKTSHELAAVKLKQDAYKAFSEMGMAIGSAVLSGVYLASAERMTQEKINEANLGRANAGKTPLDRYGEEKIRASVSQQVELQKNMWSSFFDATKSGAFAVYDLRKADLEKQQGIVESVKELSDKLFQILMRSYNEIPDSRQTLEREIDKLLQFLSDVQSTIAQQWRGGPA